MNTNPTKNAKYLKIVSLLCLLSAFFSLAAAIIKLAAPNPNGGDLRFGTICMLLIFFMNGALGLLMYNRSLKAASPQQPQLPNDPKTRLDTLHQLFKDGAITNEEHARRRDQILADI